MHVSVLVTADPWGCQHATATFTSAVCVGAINKFLTENLIQRHLAAVGHVHVASWLLVVSPIIRPGGDWVVDRVDVTIGANTVHTQSVSRPRHFHSSYEALHCPPPAGPSAFRRSTRHITMAAGLEPGASNSTLDGHAKWQAYYDSGQLPWDSGCPASQLLAYLGTCMCQWGRDATPADDIVLFPRVDSAASGGPAHMCDRCQHLKPPAGAKVVELGCGTGSSSLALAAAGYRVLGVDVVPEAIAAARGRAEAAGMQHACQFLSSDVFQLQGEGVYALAVDVQCWHAVRRGGEADADFERMLHRILQAGGLYSVMTGNDREPAVGPSTLSLAQIRAAFPASRWEVLWALQTRFDATPYYDTLPQRPLAWWVLLRKRPCA